MAVRKYSTARDILRFEGADRPAYWRRFAMLLSLSVVIATMGLLRDSAAVVISAMLVAPLMTPILGIAGAMVVGRMMRSLRLLTIAGVSAMFCVALAWIMVWVADVPRGIIIPGQVLARTDPGIEDLLVAFAAGIAGAYVQIQRSEISLLPGAAIGVALVPPLSAAGILLYFGEPDLAREAVLLFATNLTAIILSACGVYVLSGALRSFRLHHVRKRKFALSFATTFAVIAILTFNLGQSTYQRFLDTKSESDLSESIRDWADPVSIEIVRINVNHRRRTADFWLIIDLPISSQYQLATPADLLPDKVKDVPIISVIEESLGEGYQVAVRYQTRIAALTLLGTTLVVDAPNVDDLVED